MAIEHRQVHFRTSDISEVTGELAAIAEAGTGLQWITISPWVDPEHLPVVSMLQRLFSGRGSKVPEATWIAAQGNEPAQLGILHARGANAYRFLADAGTEVPSTWVTVSDHSKRGLLFAIHPDVTPEDVVTFAVAAAAALAAVPTDDRWIAQVSTADR